MKALYVAIPMAAGLLGFGLARAPASVREAPEPVKPPVESRLATVVDVAPTPPVGTTAAAESRRFATAKEISIEAKVDADIDVLRVIVPLLNEDQLAEVIENAAQADEVAWNVVFEALLTTTSPEFLEFAETALAEGKEADVSDRIGEAFSLDTNPTRKAVLGVLLGRQRKGPRAVAEIESVIQGINDESVGSVLRHLDLSAFDEGTQERMAPKLRALAHHAGDEENRKAALRILRDDRSPAGLQFLVDRIAGDSDADCRRVAFKSLLRTNPDDALRRDLVQALIGVAANRNADYERRQEAAARLRYLTTDDYRRLLSEEHHALIVALSPPEPEGD